MGKVNVNLKDPQSLLHGKRLEMRGGFSAGATPVDPVKGVPQSDFLSSSASSFSLFSKGGMLE